MAKWNILGWSGFEPETRPKWSGGSSDMFRHVGNAFLMHFVKIYFFGFGVKIAFFGSSG